MTARSKPQQRKFLKRVKEIQPDKIFKFQHPNLELNTKSVILQHNDHLIIGHLIRIMSKYRSETKDLNND